MVEVDVRAYRTDPYPLYRATFEDWYVTANVVHESRLEVLFCEEREVEGPPLSLYPTYPSSSTGPAPVTYKATYGNGTAP